MDALTREDQLNLEFYKVAVGYAQNEATIFQRRNQTFLLINGGLLALISAFQNELSTPGDPITKLISILTTLFGSTINIFWFLAQERARRYYGHWFNRVIKPLEQELNRSVFTGATEHVNQGGRWARLSTNVITSVIASLFFMLWLALLIGFAVLL